MHFHGRGTFYQIFTLSLVFSLALPAQANRTVFVQAHSTSSPRFEGFVRSRGDGLKFSDHLRQTRQSVDRVRALHELFSQASHHFLTGSLDESRKLFELITLESRTVDWALPQRRLIHLAHFRLAQMLEGKRQLEEIDQAILLDPDLLPDSKLIPPPIVSVFNERRQEQLRKIIYWDISGFSQNFDYILINGKTYDVRKGLKIPLLEGPVRLTLLSDVFAPISRVMSPDQILAMIPEGIPLVSGNCQQPDHDTEELAAFDFAVLFPEDCIANFRAGSWRKQASQEMLGTASPWTDPNIRIAAPPTESKTNWWLIGAISLVVGAVVIGIAKNQEPQRSDPIPTHN